MPTFRDTTFNAQLFLSESLINQYLEILHAEGAFIYQIEEVPAETRQITFGTVPDLKWNSLTNIIADLNQVANEYNKTSPCVFRVASSEAPIIFMKNNQSAFDANIHVQIWCRRLNQTAANVKIVQPFSRVLSLSGR